MKKLSILKDGQEIRAGKFESQEKLNLYLEKLNTKGIVGLKPERTVAQSDCSESEILSALELTPEVLDESGQIISPAMARLPADYTIEIQDITAQVEQEKINQESLAYLASTDWLIIRELDSGVPCPADIKVKRQQARDRIVK